MAKKETEKIIDEMLVLHQQNKIEELRKIKNDENESDERRIAASLYLQLPRDPKHSFKGNIPW